jgi:site-specific DNA-cytosine methylase
MIDNAPRVLCACEESQAVTERMRKMGIEAYSCDILPTSGKHPEWHIQADALQVIKIGWDAVIAFPPCTHLAVSGARWFEEKRRDGRQQMGIGFFLAFTAIDHVPHVAIENPVGIMSNLYRKPDQIIQPYQFGDPETKATCLWLKNLPKLVPTKDVREEMKSRPQAEAHRIVSMSPSPQRAMMRSKTYPGIADAMAQMWGGYLLKEKEKLNDTD